MLNLNRLTMTVLGIILGVEVQAAGTFSKELACYNSLTSTSWGANYSLDNNTVLVPAKRGEKKGFYIYSEQTSSFCEFPQSTGSNKDFTYYNLKLEGPGKNPIYMTYSDQKSNPSNPGISISFNLADSLKRKYLEPKCKTYLDEDSRSILSSDLKARVSTVKATFDTRSKIALEEKWPPLPREDFVNALKKCSVVGDGVADLANKELNKFGKDSRTEAAQTSGRGSR